MFISLLRRTLIDWPKCAPSTSDKMTLWSVFLVNFFHFLFFQLRPSFFNPAILNPKSAQSRCRIYFLLFLEGQVSQSFCLRLSSLRQSFLRPSWGSLFLFFLFFHFISPSSPAILSPRVFSPPVPFIFLPYFSYQFCQILSPRIMTPLVFSPFLFSSIILTPIIMQPFILSPGL